MVGHSPGAGGLHGPGPGLRGDNQLRVVGRDDTFSKEVTLAPAVRDYCIAGVWGGGGE